MAEQGRYRGGGHEALKCTVKSRVLPLCVKGGGREGIGVRELVWAHVPLTLSTCSASGSTVSCVRLLEPVRKWKYVFVSATRKSATHRVQVTSLLNRRMRMRQMEPASPVSRAST